MLVEEAIAMLQKCKATEYILFAYWDKSFCEDLCNKRINTQEWESLVFKCEDTINWSTVNEQIATICGDVVSEKAVEPMYPVTGEDSLYPDKIY